MTWKKRISKIKPASLLLMAGFYAFAGYNHFRDPDFYYPLIPEYLHDFSYEINWLSGVIEIGLGIGILLKPTRKWAAFGIIAMLVAFIPSHIYFIQVGGCMHDGLCVPAWVAWARLILIHPLLILWAWWHRE